MLTISQPHARVNHLQLTMRDIEPLIGRIIELCNSFTFGKHKHFDWMRGVVAMEGGEFNPHFHIVFEKPANIDFERFKARLEKVADRLCREDFELDFDYDALDWYPTKKVQKALSQPGYDRFAKVTEAHDNIGSYLTKAANTEYFLINGRKPRLSRSKLDVFVDYFNGNQPFAQMNIRSNERSFIHV